MHEYQEYPRWLYGAKGATVVVRDAEHHQDYADGWHFTPEEACAAFGEDTPVTASTDDTAKAALTARAEVVGFAIDARWSVKTLAAKVAEAEERAAAEKDK